MRRTTLAALRGSVKQSIVMRRTTLAALRGSVKQSIVMRRITLAAPEGSAETLAKTVKMMIAVIGSVVRLAKSVRITLILPNIKCRG